MRNMLKRRRRRGSAPPVDPNAPPIGGVYWRADAIQIEAEANDPIEFFGGHGGEILEPAVQETLAAQMTYDPDMGGTGTPALRAEGSQEYILPDALKLRAQEQPSTIYIVYRRRNTGSGVIFSWASTTANTREILFSQNFNGRLAISFGTTVQTAFGAMPNGRHLITGWNDTSTQRAFLGGSQVISAATGAGGIPTSVPAKIGSREGGIFLVGDIQDIIVYLSAHDDSQRATMWAWLNDRWDLGLTL